MYADCQNAQEDALANSTVGTTIRKRTSVKNFSGLDVEATIINLNPNTNVNRYARNVLDIKQIMSLIKMNNMELYYYNLSVTIKCHNKV